MKYSRRDPRVKAAPNLKNVNKRDPRRKNLEPPGPQPPASTLLPPPSPLLAPKPIPKLPPSAILAALSLPKPPPPPLPVSAPGPTEPYRPVLNRRDPRNRNRADPVGKPLPAVQSLPAAVPKSQPPPKPVVPTKA